jgi:hypothetical protein
MRLDIMIKVCLVACLVLLGFGIVMTETQKEYGQNWGTNTSNTSNDFYQLYNQTNYMTTEINKMGNDMKNDTIGASTESGLATWDSLFQGSYAALRLISRSFRFIGGMLSALASALGIPVIFIGIAMTMILIAVIFEIVYLVSRSKILR